MVGDRITSRSPRGSRASWSPSGGRLPVIHSGMPVASRPAAGANITKPTSPASLSSIAACMSSADAPTVVPKPKPVSIIPAPRRRLLLAGSGWPSPSPWPSSTAPNSALAAPPAVIATPGLCPSGSSRTSLWAKQPPALHTADSLVVVPASAKALSPPAKKSAPPPMRPRPIATRGSLTSSGRGSRYQPGGASDSGATGRNGSSARALPPEDASTPSIRAGHTERCIATRSSYRKEPRATLI